MKTFKTIALLLVGTVSSLLLMGCGEIDTGTKTSAWEKETATVVAEEPETVLTGKGPDIVSFSTNEMPNATNAQIDMDVVINIGDFSVSLYEGEQEILGKLDKMGLLYEKVEDSDNKKYNYYYNVGDGEAQFIQVYFLEKECVRIRISSNETFAHTSRGIYSGNTYSQMVDQYGDSYDKHTYMGKERYTIYRYALGECFHEFGIPGEATGEIYNVDVYVSGQMPIYDYGEEIVED